MFDNEEWKPITDFPHYAVSNRGRVRNEKTFEVRKLTISDKGFPIIMLYGADSKTRNLRHVSKLVAQEFLSAPFYDNETAVWHIDGNLHNCDVENLRWETKGRVMEWNEMHRSMTPKLNTPKVKNNRTGITYPNAFECALAEGFLESTIVFKVERQARHMEDDSARYRYIFEGGGLHG